MNDIYPNVKALIDQEGFFEMFFFPHIFTFHTGTIHGLAKCPV